MGTAYERPTQENSHWGYSVVQQAGQFPASATSRRHQKLRYCRLE